MTDLNDYQNKFDVREYLTSYYSEVTPNYVFYIGGLERAVKNHAVSFRSGGRALDFGGGDLVFGRRFFSLSTSMQYNFVIIQRQIFRPFKLGSIDHPTHTIGPPSFAMSFEHTKLPKINYRIGKLVSVKPLVMFQFHDAMRTIPIVLFFLAEAINTTLLSPANVWMLPVKQRKH